MRGSQTIILASNNYDKLEEFRSLVQPYGLFQIVLASELIRNANKLAFVESHPTYLENAIAKARLANLGAHYPCLADDTGLEVQALEGKPGVHTHRYATPAAGISQDQANIEKLLHELKDVPFEQRTARFVTALAIVIEGILITATGQLDGKIAPSPRGSNGFGYDPVFIPHGFDRTLAEMSEDEKNAISHRNQALKALFNEIKNKGIVFARP